MTSAITLAPLGSGRALVRFFAIFILLACVAVPAPAQPVAGPAPAERTLAKAQPWHVAAQDMHSRVWESTLVITNPMSGQVEQRRAKIAELSSGMNYRDEQGQWQPTREEFQLQPDGSAVAVSGPHKVAISRNLNADTAIDMLTSDGVRLRSGPLAVGYYDPVDGANVSSPPFAIAPAGWRLPTSSFLIRLSKDSKPLFASPTEKPASPRISCSTKCRPLQRSSASPSGAVWNCTPNSVRKRLRPGRAWSCSGRSPIRRCGRTWSSRTSRIG